MSEPRSRCTCIDSSGPMNTLEPSTGSSWPGHALLLDLAHRAQAEHLEAAGVGQDRAFPLHEIVQVTVGLDRLHARAQPQVEGITQDDFRANRLDVTAAACP